jgi:copper(I)-binding protein
VSRAQQNSGASRRLAATVALAAGLGLAAAGCSAGQVTQTDTQVAAVNGVSGHVGQIDVRDAQLQYPLKTKFYRAGDDARLIVTIVNNGTSPDKLTSITSPSAGPAQIEGDTQILPGTAMSSGQDQDDALSPEEQRSAGASASATATTSASPASSSVAPTSSSAGASSSVEVTSSQASSAGASSASSSSVAGPLPIRMVKITLTKLAQQLYSGQTIKVTFLFQNAGPLTLDVPVAPSPEARTEVSH